MDGEEATLDEEVAMTTVVGTTVVDVRVKMQEVD